MTNLSNLFNDYNNKNTSELFNDYSDNRRKKANNIATSSNSITTTEEFKEGLKKALAKHSTKQIAIEDLIDTGRGFKVIDLNNKNSYKNGVINSNSLGKYFRNANDEMIMLDKISKIEKHNGNNPSSLDYRQFECYDIYVENTLSKYYTENKLVCTIAVPL